MDNIDPAIDRMVAHGFLLYEYVADEQRHRLVGVVDSSAGHGIDPATGKGSDEIEADDFYETGMVLYPVTDIL